MKTIKKIILFTILAASFAFMGCDQLAGANKKSEPEITKKTFSDADRNDENYPKNDIGQPLFPEGTTIDFKKVEEDDLTTIDYTATLPDGTITVFHEKFEAGKIETTTSKSTTTFPDTSEKETEVVEITDKNGNAKTGNQKDKKTTTKYKDGTIITETSSIEGYTQNKKASKEIVKPDGSKEKEVKEQNHNPPENQPMTEDGYRLESTEESTLFTYDAEGKELTKTVTVYDNPQHVEINNLSSEYSFFNKAIKIDYKYVNGEPVETKHTETINQGCYQTKETVPNTDGTKTITIELKDLNYGNSLGTGSGTIDKNGVSTIEINYTNGIDVKTVENKDTVTKEILVTNYGTKEYYEKTVTEKGVLISKECEYLYDRFLGIVFKTVTTYTGGTETRKSGRYISGDSSPANYDSKHPKVPGNNSIYDDTTDIEIYADGHNAEPYTTFTTKAWNGPKSDYDIIDYPFDSSVDMTNLHLLSAE